MEIRIERNQLVIHGTGALEMAFVEDTLGLRKLGDAIELKLETQVSEAFGVHRFVLVARRPE